MRSKNLTSKAAGFSLVELIIAMAITLSILTVASTLLARGFNVRTRENQKSDALADVQRALSIMSREIANAGFNIDVSSGTNSIIAADSGISTIRFCSNLNKFDTAATTDSRNNVQDPGEDVVYFLSVADNTTYLARYDRYADTVVKQKTVLANRIDSFNIHYFNQRVTYTANVGDTDISNWSAAEVAPSAATYIVIALSVTLDQVGTEGAPGYQPPFRVLLVSDVALRNHDLTTY